MSDPNTFSFRFYDRAFGYDVAYPALQFNLTSYSFTAEGGPELADFDAFGTDTALWDAVDFLRRPLEIIDFTGEVRWWGYVSEVQLLVGMYTVGVTLDTMFNQINVTYTDPTISSAQFFTGWSVDAVSTAIYGIKQQIQSAGTTTITAAQTQAATALTQSHYPVPTIQMSPSTKGLVAHIKCRGWYDTLGWQYYSQAAGKEVYEEADTTALIGVGSTSTGIGFDAVQKRIWDLDDHLSLYPANGKLIVAGAANSGNNGVWPLASASSNSAISVNGTTIATQPGKNEVQSIVRPIGVGNGTFQLTFAPSPAPTTGSTTQTTTSIVWNASAATLQAALEALPGIGTGNVLVQAGTAAIPQPGRPVLVASTTGGILGANSYNYVISAVNISGQTVATFEAITSVVTTGTTSSITVSWPASAGASSYNVYGRYYHAEGFLANVAGTSYTDTGADIPAGAPPTTDTTASTWTVTYQGTLAYLPQNVLTASSTFTAVLTITEAQKGRGGRFVDSAKKLTGFAAGDMIRVTGSGASNGNYYVTGSGGAGAYVEVQAALTTTAAGASITLSRGSFVTVTPGAGQVLVFELPGASVTLTNWGNTFAQRFQQNSGAGWTIASVSVRCQTVGTPADSLRVSLYTDNATFGVPGTVIVSYDTSAASVPQAMDWLHVAFTAPTTIAASTYYWLVVERTGANDPVNAFEVNYKALGAYNQGYAQVLETANNTWQSPAGQAYRLSDMAFRVVGGQDLTTQIASIVTGVGQFLAGSRIITPSGVFSSQYRDGSLTGLNELTNLTAKGSIGGYRILCQVTRDRTLDIKLEPAQGVSNWALTNTGKLVDAFGNEVPPRVCVVGVWCDLRDVVPAGASTHAIATPSPFFIERNSFIAATQELRIEPRTGTSPWNLGTTHG